MEHLSTPPLPSSRLGPCSPNPTLSIWMTFSSVSYYQWKWRLVLNPAAHGMRTIDVLKKWCHISDPEVLEKEVVRFETAILDAAEEIAKSGNGASGIEVLPGVRKLLDDLSSEKDKRGGEEKWAICTSCELIAFSHKTIADLSNILLRRSSDPHCRSDNSKSLRHCRLCHPRKTIPRPIPPRRCRLQRLTL